MTKIKLLDWEENGHHDSYFYLAVWNPETGAPEKVLTGSTAFHSVEKSEEYAVPTPETAEQARVWLAETIFSQIRSAEARDIAAPNTVTVGERVALGTLHRSMVRLQISKLCAACGGGGKWVHPRNSADRRPCFACKGAGAVQAAGDPVKIDGKQQWERFEPGTAGTVTWVGSFRTMPTKGYNKPDRETLSTRIRFDDGRSAGIPLKKLRLDQEPTPDRVLRQRAEELSRGMNFMPLLTTYQGWATHNWAREALQLATA